MIEQNVDGTCNLAESSLSQNAWGSDMRESRTRVESEDRDGIIDDMSDDPIFLEEQQHLCSTYSKLEQLAQDAIEQIEDIERNAGADKRSMGDELSINYDSADDIIETYAAFASMNRIIEAYDVSRDINVQKLADIRLLLEKPYFAKVTLDFENGKPARDIYIGDVGMYDADHRHLVVDWRAPIAETYYNQDMGPTSYEANGRTIHANLLVRRQFDIVKDRLISYFDTSVAIQDALLLSSLGRHRTDHMQAITTTIQKEQNRVIRFAGGGTLLVNGVAGSGKTSVMLQRIAYLLYRDRDALNADEITVITPNKVFRKYIDGVLPNMGEHNPKMITFDELKRGLLPKELAKKPDDTCPKALETIESTTSSFAFDPGDFCDIRCAGEVLIKASSVRKIADKFRNGRDGSHRMTLIREELLKRLDARLAQMASNEDTWDKIVEMSLDEQLSMFQEPFDPDNEKEAKRLARIYVDDRFSEAAKAVEGFRWIRTGNIARRILDKDKISPLEWLYTKLAVSGMGDEDAKHVLIDEVQDYSQAQLAILARYYSRAQFMLLGDPNQAITESSSTFSQIREVFSRLHGEVAEEFLNISYRSAPEIANLFGALARQDGEKAKVESVQRDSDPPHIVECEDDASWARELSCAISEAMQATMDEGLYAMLAASREDLDLAIEALRKEGAEIPEIIDDKGALPDKGVVALELDLAKGLEFDGVVACNASKDAFSDGDLDRRRLYTMLSRATKRLAILSRGGLTHWLENLS